MRQFAEQRDAQFVEGLPEGLASRLSQMLKRGAGRQPWDVVVCHSTPDMWHKDGAFGWGRVEPCPPAKSKLSPWGFGSIR